MNTAAQGQITQVTVGAAEQVKVHGRTDGNRHFRIGFQCLEVLGRLEETLEAAIIVFAQVI